MNKSSEMLKYDTFEELDSAYGLNSPEKVREDLTEEEERAYVNACFDLYEKMGFSDIFDGPYEDAIEYHGMKFKVLGRATEDDVDLEELPMWNIQLENGEKIIAEPEEICLAEKNL